MKKSQILAAIALALAAGVALPVAGASAFELPDNTNGHVGTATCTDIANAIAAVNATVNYKNIKAYRDAVEAYNNLSAAQKASIANITSTNVYNATQKLGTDFTNIQTALSTGGANVANTTLMNLVDNSTATTITTTDYAAVLAAAEATPQFNQWRTWVEMLSSGSAQAKRDAAKQIQATYQLKDAAGALYPVATDANLDDIVSLLTTTGWRLNGIYTGFKTFINDVDDFKKKDLTLFNQQVSALTSALNALKINKQLAATAGAGEAKFNGATVNGIADLTTLLGFGNNDIYYNAEWTAVENAVDSLDDNCGVLLAAQSTNYIDIVSLATKYGTALNSKMNNVDIAKILVSYKAATNTDPSTDIPKDEDKKPTVSAPDTGALTAADNSASATISIVAGLATALAALGAGVVAFRSARRSK